MIPRYWIRNLSTSAHLRIVKSSHKEKVDKINKKDEVHFPSEKKHSQISWNALLQSLNHTTDLLKLDSQWLQFLT